MKIHLKSRPGLFTVANYGRDSITLNTKHKIFSVPCSDFKCFAGGEWADAEVEEQRLFLSVTNPHLLVQTLATEAHIRALASLIDLQEQAKANVPTPQVVEEDDDDIFTTERTPDELRQTIDVKNQEIDRLKNKMRSIATAVYSQNIDHSNFQFTEGIKFIIQESTHDEERYRMCYDPYGFVDNFHSEISAIYRNGSYYTKNGGWMKIIGKDVILYSKSGDYGVYNDEIATACAQKLFPNKNIHSFAGQQWQSEWDDQFIDLPF